MIKAWIAFWAAALAILAGLIFWRNHWTYKDKTTLWKTGKSVADMIIIVSTAAWLPTLLIAWSVLWLTRPIKTPAYRMTAAVISSMALGILGAGALEALVLCSIWAVDLLTGTNGFLGHWQRLGEQEISRSKAA